MLDMDALPRVCGFSGFVLGATLGAGYDDRIALVLAALILVAMAVLLGFGAAAVALDE